MSYVSAFFAWAGKILYAVALYGAYSLGKDRAKNAQLETDNAVAREHNAMADTIRGASRAELDERMQKYTRK